MEVFQSNTTAPDFRLSWVLIVLKYLLTLESIIALAALVISQMNSIRESLSNEPRRSFWGVNKLKRRIYEPHSVILSLLQDAPVKLCDFGFAKIDQGDLMTPQFTPYYVAPQVNKRTECTKACLLLLRSSKWHDNMINKNCMHSRPGTWGSKKTPEGKVWNYPYLTNSLHL